MMLPCMRVQAGYHQNYPNQQGPPPGYPQNQY